jgi:hypothetical protein
MSGKLIFTDIVRKYFGDLGIYGRKISKCILEKQDVKLERIY